MPSLRILTWNSKGEDVFRATTLRHEINTLNNAVPTQPVGIIVHQEAQQPATGAITMMLNDGTAAGLGPNYTRPPRHITEHATAGMAYNVLVHNTVNVTTLLQRHNYATDATFGGWINRVPQHIRNRVIEESQQFRPPVYMDFTYAANAIRLITWHAPLGDSAFLTGCRTKGRAPLDAFLFIDQSALLTPHFDLYIIAGDLNMTKKDLGTNCHGYEPLDDFGGETSHVDHVLAWRPNGAQPTYSQARAVGAPPSDHCMFSCVVNW